jgi:hypothetical protein
MYIYEYIYINMYIGSLQEMHTWLFTQHSAYKSSRLIDTGIVTEIDAETLKSY